MNLASENDIVLAEVDVSHGSNNSHNAHSQAVSTIHALGLTEFHRHGKQGVLLIRFYLPSSRDSDGQRMHNFRLKLIKGAKLQLRVVDQITSVIRMVDAIDAMERSPFLRHLLTKGFETQLSQDRGEKMHRHIDINKLNTSQIEAITFIMDDPKLIGCSSSLP